MNAPERNDDQLIDLLIKESTEGLTAAERAELDQLSQQFPDIQTDTIDNTVAALSVALTSSSEPLPSALRERILAAAVAGSASAPADMDAARARRSAVAQPTRTGNTGWWAAAAATVLAITGWWPRLVSDPQAVVATRTPTEIRNELLASGRAIRASWSPPAAPGTDALVGDVVFDPVTQRGFLTFRGIPPNDPRLAQYQLWIVDARRKQPEPIDGGVFDVTGAQTTPGAAGNDVVIPFEARLPVGQPAAFVVTLEQPGGVVISKQERVLALAKVGTT